MGNSIGFHRIKLYNPSLCNTSDNGTAKTIVINDVTRLRFSSASQKSVWLKGEGLEEIRTSHIEDLVDMMLDTYVQKGEITEEQKDKVGFWTCSSDILGCANNHWRKRRTLQNVQEDTAEEEAENEAEQTSSTEEGDGRDPASGAQKKESRQIVHVNMNEMMAILNAMVRYEKETGLPVPPEKQEKKKGKGKKKGGASPIKGAVELVKKELKALPPNKDKAWSGSMAADGVLGTWDGALQVAHSFSIDAYHGEVDSWGAWHKTQVEERAEDPIYGAVSSFKSLEDEKNGKQAANLGQTDIASNVMYSFSCACISDYYKELKRMSNGEAFYESQEFLTSAAIEKARQHTREFALDDPIGKQTSAHSSVIPAIVYVEVVKGGTCLEPDFSAVVHSRHEVDEDGNIRTVSVTEQGVEKILEFAGDDSFQVGEVRRYILMSREYRENKTIQEEIQAIKDAGLHVEVVQTIRQLMDKVEEGVKWLS